MQLVALYFSNMLCQHQGKRNAGSWLTYYPDFPKYDPSVSAEDEKVVAVKFI